MKGISLLAACAVLASGTASARERPTSENDPAFKKYLEAYPEADTDGDGVLTWWEKEQHLPREARGTFLDGSKHIPALVAMRDGFRIPAEAFLPVGRGPFPVMLCRAGYGRWGALRYGTSYNREGFAYVVTDLRKYDGGRHDNFQDKESSENEIEDTFDTMEWISKQPWCDGNVGTVGGSGNGFASAMGFWCGHPAYKVNNAGNTAGNLKLYWAFHNGVARREYNWLGVRGVRKDKLVPTIAACGYDPESWKRRIDTLGEEIESYYFNSTGWYDPLCQGALDDFAALQDGGRVFVRIEPRGHGGTSGFGRDSFKFPTNRHVTTSAFPRVTDILRGKPVAARTSVLKYFLMGDVMDATAPGNHWCETSRWPVPHTDVAYYLGGDDRLSTSRPSRSFTYAYRYDPADPAPSFGGHYTWAGKRCGPHDQRRLRERDDVVYFETDALEVPVVITGNVDMVLHFSSTADDTAFVVKLVDVYPDGYEAIVRESAGMGRYHAGFDEPSPLRAGEVYELRIDMWSTAYAFNRAHRIAVVVTSSSKESYEVHPNSYRRIPPAAAKPCENRIHVGARHASRIIVPVVAQ